MSHSRMPSHPHDTGLGATAARVGLGVGIPALFIALAYIPYLILRSELPDQLATHFDLTGTPDGTMTVTSLLLATSVLVAAGVVICVSTALGRPAEGSQAATAGFLGGFLGTLGASVLASTVVTQRGLENWTDAGSIGWTLGFVALSTTGVGALAAWLATRCIESSAPLATPNAPVMELADGEAAAWSTTLHSVPMFVVGIGAAIIGLLMIATANRVAGALLMLTTLPLTALATLYVCVDRSGLRVKYGWLPRPTTHIDIDEIETAQVIDVRPREWGGWGYRGSLKLMRRAAVVHRAGPGIRLDLTNNKVFVVTVDDPEIGVGLLNALLQRRAAISPPIR